MALRNHSTGRRDALNIDPRILEIDPKYNVRKINPKDPKFLEFKASIKANGVKVPLTARTEKTDASPLGEAFLIVSGHRRLTAVRELIAEGVEIKTVPVIGVNMSEEDLTVDLIISNDGEPLNQIEQGEVFKRLVGYGWTPEQIGEKVGRSVTHVNNCLKAVALPVEVKKAVFKGEISASQALNMSKEHGTGEALKKEVSKAVTTAKAAGKKKATAKTVKAARGKPELSQDVYTPIMNALGNAEFPKSSVVDGKAIVAELETYLNRKYNIQ